MSGFDCTPKDCKAFLSCQSPTAQFVIYGYMVLLVVMFIASFVFLRLIGKSDEAQENADQKNQQKNGLQKRLSFHSTDDSPREFTQTGYKFSCVGAALLYSWLVLFGIGYFYIVTLSFLIYAPDGLLWFTSMPEWYQDFFHACDPGTKTNYPSVIGPYVIVFTGTHILWLVLSMTWETLRVSFMQPAGTLGEGATHVLIEEEIAAITDGNLRDSDSQGCVAWLETKFLALTARFNAGATRTVVPILKEGSDMSIEYTCVRYALEDTDEGPRYRPRGIVNYSPMELHAKLEQGGMTETDATHMIKECGKNEISVHVPGVFEALITEFADFTYAFNSIGTWSYLVYSAWNIGIFWLIMTISSGSYRSLGIVRPNQKKIAELAQLKGMSTVLRGNKWTQVQISNIVLGDVIRVEGNDSPLPCDGIVVQGSLVVNESMLTGEPMPIQKMPVEKSENATVGKKNEAYSGTKCMQSIGPSDGKALMVATSVGALTTRGQLVRMVLFPTSVRFRYNDQMPIVYAIIFAYMLILCAIYLSPLMDLGDWVAKYMMLLNTVAMCLSPMLPVSLVMGQAVAATRLKADHDIQCLQPARIPIAGKISTVVFDKTGTITKDGMDFDAVIPVDDTGKLGQPIKVDSQNPSANPAKIEREVPKKLQYALASCHTVTTLPPTPDKPEGILVGNAVECAMVAAVGWKLGEKDVTSPSGEVLPIAKKLDFDHKRMTSGVVIKKGDELVVFIKGSYEKVQALSKPEAVPANYGDVTERCAKDGYYVLGIATKVLPASMEAQLVDMTRDQIEDGLTVCGLLLFRNEMKRDSPDAIAALKAGGIRSVICTGDNALTGMAIGIKCGIVTSSEVLLGEILENTGKIEWRDPNVEGVNNVDINAAGFADRNLAVTQAAWRHLHKNEHELDRIWTRLTVFARMKPEDKINVVKYFQGRGLIVGMAGDGGNDCGGLRAAHAGLALSDAEASMVSPFSTGRDGGDGITLMAMVDVVREGRACLATNMGTFTYFMVYCFVLTTIRTILAVVSAINFGEFVWFFMDVAINIVLVGTMVTSGPTPELGKYRPTATLLGPRTLAGIVYPYVSCMVFYAVAVGAFLEKQDFYTDTDGSFHPINDIGLSAALWMLRGDNYVSPVGMGFLFLTLVTTAFVNTYGGEFRHSILQNRGMVVLHTLFAFLMFFLLWAPFGPTRLNCVFRVNCDTPASMRSGGIDKDHWLVKNANMAADSAFVNGMWSGLAFWSAGGLGACFMGPQIKVWTEEWFEWIEAATGQTREEIKENMDYLRYSSDFLGTDAPFQECEGGPSDDKKAGSCSVRASWLPDAKVPKFNSLPCQPYYLQDVATGGVDQTIPGEKWGPYSWDKKIMNFNGKPPGKALNFTSYDDPSISTGDCSGPNNCYPGSFKFILTCLLLAHMAGHHVYVKFIMHGSFVDRLRKQREQSEAVELQQQNHAPLMSS